MRIEPRLAEERHQVPIAGGRKLRAAFDHVAVERRAANAAARAFGGLDDGHVASAPFQLPGGGEPGDSCSDDEYMHGERGDEG